jgi:hypothetical protein
MEGCKGEIINNIIWVAQIAMDYKLILIDLLKPECSCLLIKDGISILDMI